MAKRRARDEDGKFIPDDPSTPENEAWVEIEETPKVQTVKSFGYVAGRQASQQVIEEIPAS